MVVNVSGGNRDTFHEASNFGDERVAGAEVDPHYNISVGGEMTIAGVTHPGFLRPLFHHNSSEPRDRRLKEGPPLQPLITYSKPTEGEVKVHS